MEEIKQENVELQTTFNEDGIDVLCTEDTSIENVDAEEVEENEHENN